MPETPFHILLVEDDASVRDAVASSLRDEGYAVRTANDGQEAINVFAPGTDLVIADLMMPNVDGRSLLRWVTQNHPETAVILMTGFGTIPQAVEAIKAGATAYLTKPLQPDELLHHVKKRSKTSASARSSPASAASSARAGITATSSARARRCGRSSPSSTAPRPSRPPS